MVENRCPMCGQDNAPQAEECEHCQARLTPLMIDPSSQSRELGGTTPGFDKTDDLSSLRLAGLGGEADDESLDEETARITDDWQAAFKTETQLPSEEIPPTMELGGDVADEPDWLQRIRDAEKNQPAPLGDPLAGQEDASSDDEWLDSVRSKHEDSIEDDRQQGKLPENTDDWMHRLQDKQEKGSFDEAPSTTPDQDWLADAESALEEPEGEEPRDWLSGITGDLSDYVFPDSETGALKKGDLDLAGMQDPPDWMLDTVEPDSDIQAVIETPFEEAPPEKDPLADWLAKKDEDALEVVQTPASDMPDWISDMAAEKKLPEDKLPSEDRPLVEDKLSLEEQAPSDEMIISTEEDAADIETDALPAANLPDWLSSAAPKTAPDPHSSDDLPDWMDGVKPSPIYDTIIPASEPDLVQDDAEDPWESIRIQPAEDKTVDLTEPVEPEEDPADKAPKPDWLSSVGTGPLPASADIKSTPAFSAEMELDEEDFEVDDVVLPDWMSELDPEAEPDDPFFPEEDEEMLELAPAELPTWLQAMRPVELMAEDELLDPIDGEVVAVGPLAGLRGVLPAEPDIILFGKPPEYPARLQITDKQQEYASLMEDMIKNEDEVVDVEETIFKLPQQVLRWLAAGLLFLAVLIPVYTGSTQVELPTFTPPEVQSSLDLINAGFENQAPILAIFDYQPALSSELEASAAAVIDHMMYKGAHLTLISTSPTGPGLSENYLQTSFTHNYLKNGDYVQLGYLSGGATGIQLFARAPRMAMPLMVTNQQDDTKVSIWDHPDLDNIASINDFSMVLLITDDPDTARSWIEQTGEFLIDTPLMLIVSAQAEPFVFPYYQVTPRQVDGIVAGLNGAAYYETNTSGNLTRRYWDAYSYAIIVSLIMLLAGGGYYTVTNLLEKRKSAARGMKS